MSTDAPRARFGLSGSQGVAFVGQGNWYVTYPEIAGIHARLGVQWNNRFATFVTLGGSPVPWLYSYEVGARVEWTALPFVAIATGVALHGFPINDAAAHAIAVPVAISFLPWRRAFGGRNPAFTVTLSVAPGYTTYMPWDGCYCAPGTVRPNGFTFVGQIEVGFDLR